MYVIIIQYISIAIKHGLFGRQDLRNVSTDYHYGLNKQKRQVNAHE